MPRRSRRGSREGGARGMCAGRAPWPGWSLASRSAAQVAASGLGGLHRLGCAPEIPVSSGGGAGGSGSQMPPIWSAALPNPVRALGVFPAGLRPPPFGPDPGRNGREASGRRAAALRSQAVLLPLPPVPDPPSRPQPPVHLSLRESPLGPTVVKCVLL